MAVGKSIWKKSSIQWLDNVIKKAKDIIKKDKEETLEDVAEGIDNSTQTLDNVANNLQQQNLNNVTQQLKSSPIDINITQPWRYPNYISSLNPLNRNNGILNKSLTDFSNPKPYSSTTANVGDNIFKTNLVTTPEDTVANKVQTLINAWYQPWVDPDLLIRFMEGNWYWYDTSTFDDSLLWDTTGMTDEQINLLREQKSKKFYEEQREKNNKVNNKIQNLDANAVSYFEHLVKIRAEELNELEEDGLSDLLYIAWGTHWRTEWVLDFVQKNVPWSAAWWLKSTIYAKDGVDIWAEEFRNEIISYALNKKAYDNWERDKPELPTLSLWQETLRIFWENKKSLVQLTDDDLSVLASVYDEAMEDYYKKKEVDQARISELREQLWIEADEKISSNWIIKAYRDYSKFEDEKKDVEEKSTNFIVDKLSSDPKFMQLNSVQKERMFNTVYSHFSDKLNDKYWYLKQYDKEINKILWWVYTFANEKEKQTALVKIRMLRDNTKKIIDTYLQNALEAEIIYAEHWWDEISAQKEMRQIMWWWENEWLDVNVLSSFYMKWLDSDITVWWLDVDNRLFNLIRPGIGEMDDIIYDTGNEWLGTHIRHEFEYWAWLVWEAIEWALNTGLWIPYLLDVTPADWGMYAAGETQLWVYKKNYDLASDSWKFFYNLAWIAPEVWSLFVPVWGAVKWWLGVLTKLGKVENMMNKLTRFSSVVNRMEEAISKWAGWLKKATNILWKYINDNQAWKMVGKIANELVDNFWMDWYAFNRWDSEYMTSDQDTYTYLWALFAFANMDLLWAVADSAKQTLLFWVNNLPEWNSVIDKLKNTVSKNIWAWWTLAWSFVDISSYFSSHPDELASAVLRELWVKWDTWILWLISYIKNGWTGKAREMLNTVWTRIFEQSRQASKILNKLKQVDYTWVIAAWEKKYVWAMLSSLLSWKNTVNNQELVRMIENTWYWVPDMVKRYTNSIWTMRTNAWDSKLFTQLDSEKMHLVDYDRRLDLVTDNTFSPIKVWDKEDIQKAYDWLDRMWVWYKDVFENPENSLYFKETWLDQYVLTKEWLDALWYSNNKLVPEVLAQSKETTDFVENLRKINNNNKTEVISESLINEIEQTDAYEKLSSALSKYVC